LAILCLGVGALFIPGPAWLPAVQRPAEATAFLGLLWQVIAAAAGLSITVVFFALQSMSTGRGSAVRDALLVGRFQSAIYLSIASLFVTGLDLLHVGHDAPGGWAAAWATLLSGLAVLAVAARIAGLASVMSPAFLQRRRIASIRRSAETHVDQEALSRVALNILDSTHERLGFEWSVFRSSAGHAIATAARAGTVRDVQLRRLSKLAVRARDSGSGAVRLATYLGATVSAGDGVVFRSSEDAELAKRPRRLVRVGTPRAAQLSPDLFSLAEELHSEAIQAIRDARLTDYQGIAEAQRELLLAMPNAWQARYGQTYTHELAQDVFPLRFGPVSRVVRNMYEQMRAAVGTGLQDLALDVAYEPLHTASKAARLDAPGLAKELLDLAGEYRDDPGRGHRIVHRSRSRVDESQPAPFADRKYRRRRRGIGCPAPERGVVGVGRHRDPISYRATRHRDSRRGVVRGD
jgi:hypothetical protein